MKWVNIEHPHPNPWIDASNSQIETKHSKHAAQLFYVAARNEII